MAGSEGAGAQQCAPATRLLGGGRFAGSRSPRSPGAPAGVKAFEYRRVKKIFETPPTWPICCGWAGCRRRGSPHRRLASCGNWCGTGPSWSGCGRAARPRCMRAGQVRDPGADERPVRARGQRPVGPAATAGTVCGPNRVATPTAGGPGVRDRPVRRPGPGPAGPRPRLSRGAAGPRDRPDPGGGVRRRDRRRLPVHHRNRSWPAGPG
jgi:hypothetical protein